MSNNAPEGFVLIGTTDSGDPVYVRPEPNVPSPELSSGAHANSPVTFTSEGVSGLVFPALPGTRKSRLTSFTVSNYKTIITLVLALVAAIAGVDMSGLANLIP